MVEIDGDGDPHVEPGETWAVRPRVRNVGSETALGVTARLASSTPGVLVLDPAPHAFGDLAPGAASGPAAAFEFTVDPTAGCGFVASFDLLGIAATNAPGVERDEIDAFDVPVDNGVPDPIHTVLLDENFDAASLPDWTHRAVDPGLSGCNRTYQDEWSVQTKDVARGPSQHCGGGPGSTYGTYDHAWLHYRGLDSTGGAGLAIPASAQVATLTVVHWYDTVIGGDGAQVAIDAVADGADVYAPLVPTGGYPGSISPVDCNGLGGMPAFTGSSGGWVTHTFDLTAHRGKTVWLAFVFGSDSRRQGDGEGWYVDRVTFEIEEPGIPTCDVIRWPGSVPATVTVDKAGAGEVSVAWGDACNVAEVPGQTYAVHAGSLAALRAGGQYDHVPVGGLCDRVSPATFATGAGDEYYLVGPVAPGYQGGLGFDSTGAARPDVAGTCGLPRAESCP